MKRRPIGYVATCQCARDVGVIDLERTPRAEAGKLLGKWVSEGCTLTPKFGGNWAVELSRCVCQQAAPRIATAAEMRQAAAHDSSCVGAFARARP